GNMVAAFSKIAYTLDNDRPKAVLITKAITDDNNNLSSGETTNDSSIDIRISLKNNANLVDSGAKEGDTIQIMKKDDSGNYKHLKYATLNVADISSGYKDITALTLDNTGNDNKNHEFKARVIDEIGNKGDYSTDFSVIYDNFVESLTLRLKADTGVSEIDNITSNKEVVVDKIERGALVKYTLNAGRIWTEVDAKDVIYENSNDKTGVFTINLNDDTEYAANDISISQTDQAGNSKTVSNSIWIIDNTSAKHDATDADNFKFVRVYDNNDSDVVEEVILTLTFDENIILGTDFDKNSFTVYLDANDDSVTKPINSVEVNGKEVKIHMVGNIDIALSEIRLSYAQTVNNKALQDKAGNMVAAFSKIAYTLDNDRPKAVLITKAITDDNNNLGSGETTNDKSIDIRISLKNNPSLDDSGAKEGDTIQIMKKDDSGNYKYLKHVILSANDISLGYKDVRLPDLSNPGNDNENHEFKARVIDEIGNKGVYSTDFSVIYDKFVESLELRLKEDTGVNRNDGITSNKEIIVDKIERGALVEYTLNGGGIWKTIDAGSNEIKYSSSDDKTGELEISLNDNTEYSAGDIKVKQIDKAGNSDTVSNPSWKIDNKVIEYDATKEVSIFRVENTNKDGFESHIVLTLTEDVFSLLEFNKDFFKVSIDGAESTIVGATVSKISGHTKWVEVVIEKDFQTATGNELILSYTKTGSDADKQKQALQDVAGNLLRDIVDIKLTFDKVKPGKLEIKSIIDNRNSDGNGTGEVAEGAITDDRTLTVKVEFTGTTAAGSAAVKGDVLKYHSKDDELILSVKLTDEDIRLGYKETTLTLENSVEGKDYELSATLTDEALNVSVSSDVKKFTVDAQVAQATIKLRTDSGAKDDDEKTNDNVIEVTNIEKGATWAYSTDGGKNWDDGVIESQSVDRNDALNDKHYFTLKQNTIYKNDDIQVRQTDLAGNTNGDTGHSDISTFGRTVTDNIQPEYQSLRISDSDNKIVLNFSENLYVYSTSGTTDSDVTNAFRVKVNGSDNIVGKVVYRDGEVTLLMEGGVKDGDIVHVDYVKPIGAELEIGYRLKDNAGNEVNNFKVGGSGADTLTGDGANENIFGEGGNDTLTGGGGNDTLIGGSGNDTLTGGVGSDTFDYNATTDGNDTITDFTIGSGGDKLDFKDLLSGYDATSTLSNFLSVTDGGSGNGVTIAVDANGDGSGTDLSITLSGIGTGGLTLASFETDNLIVL
ncbi:MAG: type I secretion C-terminal target domain-containing protein, partial [Gammaproteobacteria bacterium]|nr:type I secretion C-terminal target domain-containing protein [Gammaproteobacteria bacterium]